MRRMRKRSVSKKVRLAVALGLTVAVLIVAPVYAWFSFQRKAAEMYKIEYPNSLFINAAHREDRIFFNLGGIDINDFKIDPYTQKQVVDQNGNAVKVTQMMYAFSVSGSNTTTFRLQMAHTTNNLFHYTIYEAKQFSDYNAAKAAAGNNTDLIVRYDTNLDSHSENTLQVIGDRYDDSVAGPLYYVRGNSALSGSYVNEDPNNSDLGLKDTSDLYYSTTYGSITNVEAHAVPKYWVSDVTLDTTGDDSEVDANKNFCKYFILVVTWNNAQQLTQVDKESDMIYFAVQRLS